MSDPRQPMQAPTWKRRLPFAILLGAISIAAGLTLRALGRALRDGSWTTWTSELFTTVPLVLTILVVGLIARVLVEARLDLETSPAAEGQRSIDAADHRTRRILVPGIALLAGLSVLGAGWWIAFNQTTPTLDLRVGQCIDTGGQTSGLSRVTSMPCDHPHEMEISGRLTYPAGAGTPWPGAAALTRFAEGCSDEFRRYTGMPYTIKSTVHVWHFWPQESYWNNGVRTVWCAAYRPDGQPLTESVRA